MKRITNTNQLAIVTIATVPTNLTSSFHSNQSPPSQSSEIATLIPR